MTLQFGYKIKTALAQKKSLAVVPALALAQSAHANSKSNTDLPSISDQFRSATRVNVRAAIGKGEFS
jgi:hypothetical protein